MFVLGIDPGVSRCGYGAVVRERHGRAPFRARAAGVITTSPAAPLPQRLAELARELAALVGELRPDVVAVERVFFQTNARTAMSVGQASGLALVAAARSGCEVVQYTANEVKEAVAGYGAATKAQVQEMVAVLCGLSCRPRPPDAADALGLAICHLTLARGAERIDAALRREGDLGRSPSGPAGVEGRIAAALERDRLGAAALGRGGPGRGGAGTRPKRREGVAR